VTQQYSCQPAATLVWLGVGVHRHRHRREVLRTARPQADRVQCYCCRQRHDRIVARSPGNAEANPCPTPLGLFRPTIGSKRRSVLLYWVFKYVAFAPLCRLLFRPSVSGAGNIPKSGGAILVSNHISAGDTFLLPAMIRRRLTFPAKMELFQGRGVSGRVLTWFLKAVGQLPMDRSGGRASASSMEGVVGVLRSGELLGIYPEGTRSPDGRLYKGKTGAARLVLQARVPVIPVAMINTELVRSRFLKIPTMRHPKIRIGEPMDFSAYAEAGNDRNVLRWVTDEIMNAVMQLSSQEYVDVYATAAKAALEAGKPLPPSAGHRPGAGRPTPPVPVPKARLDLPPVSDVNA
jgi:1-acyl-sn-glycerol-3-phosphate acyltransferase